MEQIVITLDMTNLLKTNKILDNLEDIIKDCIYRGLEKASHQIRTKLIQNMTKYGVESLKSGINITHDFDSMQIRITKIGPNGQDYVEFVEYGTGIIGAWNPHPHEPWKYDVGNWGYTGWWYPTTPEDDNPTKRIIADGTLIAHTRGMPSRPFFYDTVDWIRKYGTITRAIMYYLRRAIV